VEKAAAVAWSGLWGVSVSGLPARREVSKRRVSRRAWEGPAQRVRPP
jgi:hypothetical protein